MANEQKPIIVITGSAGNIGSSLTQALEQRFTVVGFDRPGSHCDFEMDLTSSQSVELAWRKFREVHGEHIASVVHLAAYFDFSGETSPLYEAVNVQGTRRLLETLQAFSVEQFIYSSTMLVHKPGVVGETIDETTPLAPQWAYPQSKADTEEVIRKAHGAIPYLILRLAGLYSDDSCVPTLAHQIARIYQRNIKSLLYAGDTRAGQAFIHQEDMIQLFKNAIDRRHQLPEALALLAGEPNTVSYEHLQNLIGQLIHGEEGWTTLSLPKALSKAGAWLQEKSEPLVPDDFDQGEKPFIRPFMIDLASHHYALDITKASTLLDWQPQHRIEDSLPKIIQALKKDPVAWFERNGITQPDWMQAASEKVANPEDLRSAYEAWYEQTHRQNLWAPMLNIGLGFWLITSPATLGYQKQALWHSDLITGLVVVVLGLLSLSPSPRFRLARWALGLAGLWLLMAPLLFWAPTAAAYLNDSLIGTLIIGFALLTRPMPGISSTAEMTGPVVPPGWDFSPSAWAQRIPIIVLAFIGFFISRYLTAYQLGHIDSVWEPFFAGALPDAKNGTEEIITSEVSKAWPVPDAGLGALVYLLEILTGIMGSNQRWRTMPWLVLLFGFMIIPLGAISITFIIIQPIILDTWCTLCLIAAAAMLLQIPYSFDEIVATIDFLQRRSQAGRPLLRILFTGDTDSGGAEDSKQSISKSSISKESIDAMDEFKGPVTTLIKNMLAGGVSVSWQQGVCMLIGVWLLLTRLTLGNEAAMADSDHLIGALVLTVSISAAAEVMRSLRFVNMFLGLALLITPFIFGADVIAILASLICGLGLILLSIPKGRIQNSYGKWSQTIW